MANTLAARIAKASDELGGALRADKQNTQGGGYWYISADKILDRAGGVLAKNGVALIPSLANYDVQTLQTAGGKSSYAVTVNFAMTISDGETTLEFPWIGMGVDYGAVDKALYKAITSGHKYFLMKLLNVGAGNEDSEHEAPPVESNSAQKSAAPPATVKPNGAVSNGKSAVFRSFMATGNEMFGEDWAAARHWLIERYTTKATPDNIRRSANDLTDAEIKTLAADMAKWNGKLVEMWQARRAELDSISVKSAPEMNPDGAAVTA